MKKLKEASQLLSQFDLFGITYGNVDIYVQGGGCVLQAGGIYFRHPQSLNAVKYSATRWQNFARNFAKEHNYDSRKMEVVALRIAFNVGGDERIFIVESSDFQKKQVFDRIIIPAKEFLGPLHEIYLTEEESASIHGIKDIVRLVDSVPKTRYVKIDSDLIVAAVKDRRKRGEDKRGCRHERRK